MLILNLEPLVLLLENLLSPVCQRLLARIDKQNDIVVILGAIAALDDLDWLLLHARELLQWLPVEARDRLSNF